MIVTVSSPNVLSQSSSEGLRCGVECMRGMVLNVLPQVYLHGPQVGCTGGGVVPPPQNKSGGGARPPP
jgi:hypothetical protein